MAADDQPHAAAYGNGSPMELLAQADGLEKLAALITARSVKLREKASQLLDKEES